ncbi:hypothetical protein D3C72_2519410 [compost metagenome]
MPLFHSVIVSRHLLAKSMALTAASRSSPTAFARTHAMSELSDFMERRAWSMASSGVAFRSPTATLVSLPATSP